MVTTAQEYFANLDLLQNVNQPAHALLPSADNIYNIDINSRKIEAPEFLSVQKDFKSETIYFAIDRFAGYMDLAQTCCIIQYRNLNSDKGTRFYSVPFYDIYKLAHMNKIVFPWCLDAYVSEKAGPVEFSIRFFKIGEKINGRREAEKVLTYNLNTLPAESKVLYGFAEQQLNKIDDYYLQTTQYEQLSNAIMLLGNVQKLRWTVLDDNFTGSTIDVKQIQLDLNKILEAAEKEENNNV